MTFLRTLALSLIALFWVPLVQAQSHSVISGANLTFTTIDVPGAVFTVVSGINGMGDMVGGYSTNFEPKYHGFLYRNGTFTYFDYPGRPSTRAEGINDSGLIVGWAGGYVGPGFLYDGTTFTTIRRGDDDRTFVMGINNVGDLVGGTGSKAGTGKAFQMRNGHFQAINIPGHYFFAWAHAINNLGTVVGYTTYDAFKYDHGRFQNINFPGATTTWAMGINDSDITVGYYVSDSCGCGFALKDGKYLSFNFPGALATYFWGINNAGQVVGQYTVDNLRWHGFVTSPITEADFQ
jgi:probable HAF family extracellular repeat protein